MAYEQVDQSADIEMGLGPEAPQSPSLRERFNEFRYHQSYESFRGAAESQRMRHLSNIASRVKNPLPDNAEGRHEDEYDINALLRSEDADSTTCEASDISQASDHSSTQGAIQSEIAESVLSGDSSSDAVLVPSVPPNSVGESHDSSPLPAPPATPGADNESRDPQPPPVGQVGSSTDRTVVYDRNYGERVILTLTDAQAEFRRSMFYIWVCVIFMFALCCVASNKNPDAANTPEAQ